mgnify:CR=1 FL=1
MKKKDILMILIALFAISLYSQSWISSNKISCTETMLEVDSEVNSNGEVYSFGYFSGVLKSAEGITISAYGGRDYFIIKFLPDGKVEWMSNLGSNTDDWVMGGIGLDTDGNIYITGAFQNYLKYSMTDSIESTGGFDIFLAEFTSNGDIDWIRNIGTGAKRQISTTLRVDNENDIIIAGDFIDSIKINNDTTLFSDNSTKDYFFGKFNPDNGDCLWIRQFRTLSNKPGNIWDIKNTSNHYLLTGIFSDTIGFDTDTVVPFNESSDVHILKTNLQGDIEWIRVIAGNKNELSYSIILDDEENIYVTGYYDSDTLIFDENETEKITAIESYGSYDIFIAKYSTTGNLIWYKTIGGKSEEKVLNLEFFDEKLYLSGYFTDTLKWGGIQLITSGINDRDMFTGALDMQGNFREANSYKGRNQSTDEARGLFKSGEDLYIVMRSNSDLLVLGDSIYTSDGISYNMYLGVIGCLPISIDNVIVNDVSTCYGDSTGGLQIQATGGFGSPYQYSIDNGLSYQSNAFFQDLPAGNYPVVVIDQENCAQEGPVANVGQPDSLEIELISSADITNEGDGSIVVAASGGTTPYTFTLLPDNLVQGFGTYTFQPGDSGRYVVQVDDAHNCGPVKTDSITIQDFYGVGFDDLSELEVRIYPNPASGMITLEMPFEEAECTLEVLSLTGQVVMSRQVYSTGGVLRETIDVSDLSKGMYMLRVDGKTLRSGIVVN